MPVRSNSGSKIRRLRFSGLIPAAVTIMAVLTLAVAAVSARAWFAKTGKSAPRAAQEQAAQGKPIPPFRQSVRVWVHGDRVSPDVIYVRPGPLLLQAENETGADVSLVVERQLPDNSKQVHGLVKTVRQGKRARLEVELGAGEYIFYDESRPKITGRLIVDPSPK